MSKISFCSSHRLTGKLLYTIEYLSLDTMRICPSLMSDARKEIYWNHFKSSILFMKNIFIFLKLKVFVYIELICHVLIVQTSFAYWNVMNWKMQVILILALCLVRCSTFQIYHERMKFILDTCIFSKYSIYLWKYQLLKRFINCLVNKPPC